MINNLTIFTAKELLPLPVRVLSRGGFALLLTVLNVRNLSFI